MIDVDEFLSHWLTASTRCGTIRPPKGVRMYRDYKLAADRVNPVRWAAKIKKLDSGCWEWTAGLTKSGYPRFNVDRVSYYAHRLAYVMAHGFDDRSLVVDHLCRNRKCVNPDHLELVSQQENVHRGAYGLRTHCKHGHSLADASKRKDGQRRCRTCERLRSRRRRENA